MMELKIDPEFKNKIPPLTPDEFSRLEANIVSDGEIREPLVIWNGIIVDGHNRYTIAQKHPEIPFTVKEMDFPDRWAAVAWMCANQLGRRNLSEENRTYLLGKEYEARMNTHGGNRDNERNPDGTFAPSAQNGHLRRTAEIMAHTYGVGHNTVRRSADYARGLDAAEEASPGFREEILSGQIAAPKSVIQEMRNDPPEVLAEKVETIRRGEPIYKEPKPLPIPTEPPKDEEYSEADFVDILNSIAERFEMNIDTHMRHHGELLTPIIADNFCYRIEGILEKLKENLK